MPAQRRLRDPTREAAALVVVALLIAAPGLLGACGDESSPTPAPDACDDPVLCPDLGGDADGDAGDVADEEPVECTADGQCADDRYCDSAGNCVLGCRLSPDNCRDECATCDPDSRSCEVDPVCANACGADDECGGNQYCDLTGGAGAGQCRTGCRLDAPECPDADLGYCCNTGEVCDPESHLCRAEPCETDFDCPALQFCRIPDGDPLGAQCADGCRLDPDNCRSVFGAGPTDVCDPDSHICEPIDCGSDDELCPNDYVCEAGRCRPGCRGDDDCSSGQPCDPITRLCGCQTDEDCDELTVCVDESCEPRCEANADCPGSRPFCNDDSGRCFAGCANEGSEPNNAPTAAADFGDDATLFGVLCGVDEDWFQVDGNAGETVRLTVGFDPGTVTVRARGGSEFDDTLIDPVTASAPDSVVVVNVAVADDGPIAVGFSGRGAPAGGSDALTLGYVAQIARFPTDSCQPDAREDDDSPSQAELDPIAPGTLTGLSLCADDAGGDWFAFTLPADRRATVSLDHDDPDAGVRLEILDSSLAVADDFASDEAVGSSLFAEAGPFPGGLETDLFIRVTGIDAGVDELFEYSLRLDFDEVAACEPDALEAFGGDDTPATATPSGAVVGGPAQFDDLTACNFDQDWFSLNALANGTIEATVVQTSTGRDLEIAIVDDDGETVLASDTDASLDPRTLTLGSVPATGGYYVRVTDVGGSDTGADGVDYALTIVITGPVCTDAYEDDDALDQATPAVGGGTLVFDTNDGAAGRACRDDEDWFSAVLESDGTLQVDMTIQSPGEVALDLLAVDGESTTVIASGVLAGASLLRIPQTELPAGTYAVRSAPTGFLPLEGVSYRLRIVATLDGLVCEDGGIDPGDTPDLAAVTSSGRTGERICPGDGDWWRINLPGPTRLTVGWTLSDLADCPGDSATSGASGALYASPPAGALAQRPVDTCTGTLTHDYLNPGEALFLVEDDGVSPPVPPAGFTYDFAVTSEAIATCTDPVNASAATARRLQPDTQAQSRVCDGGAVWHLVGLAADTRHTFTLQRLTGDAGDPDLRLDLLTFDETPTLVRGATTDGDTVAQFATNENEELGLYYLRVQPTGPAPLAGLQLQVDWSTETPTTCEPDFFEPNDVETEALIVGGDMQEPVVICPGDVDWFLAPVQLTGGTDVTTDVTFRVRQLDDAAPLRLRVYSTDETGAADTLLGEEEDSASVWSLAFADLPEGDYLVEVAEGAGGPTPEVGLRYHLDVLLEPLVCTDYLEENDDAGSAIAVPVDQTVVYQNLLACEGDLDVFALTVTEAGTDLTVTVDRVAPSTDLDVALRDGVGSVVASASGGPADAQVVLDAPDLSADTYLVELSAANPGLVGERYTLTLSSVAPFVCAAADTLEPNDTTAAAFELALPVASVSSRICDAGSAGYDYFRVAPTLGPVSLDAQLSNPTGADLTLSLRDAGDGELTAGPVISQSGLSAGTYYLRVASSDPGPRGAPYGLAVQTALFGCPSDVDEPNNAPGAGLPPPPGFGQPRVLCDTDDDYFAFTADDGLNVNVSVAHDATPYPVLVEILRASDLSLVNSCAGDVNDPELRCDETSAFKSLWAFDVAAGDYLVRLSHAVPGGETPPENGLTYELAVLQVGDTPCSEDPFEPNDDPFSTEPIPGTAAAILCPGEADWYEQPVRTTLGDIDLSLTFDDTGSDSLTLALFEPDGSTLIDSVTSDSSPIALTALDLGIGSHRVRVTGSGTPTLGRSYDVSAGTTERGCQPDLYEPNESIGAAATPGVFQLEATICSDTDVDVYALESDGSIVVGAATAPICEIGDTGCVEPTPAELEVRLFDPDEEELAHPFELSTPGTYYAQVIVTDVIPLPTQGQPYTFNWTTGPACEDDAFDPGGDSTADPAEGALVGTEAELVLCGADHDVIRYTTPSGGPSDVRAQVLLGSGAVTARLELFVEGDLVTPAAVDPGASSPSLSARAAGVPGDTDVFVVLRLEPAAGVRVPYDLTVDIGAACGDDGAEPNETAVTATPLSDGVPFVGTLCPDDVDLFVTSSVPAGAFTATVDSGGDVIRGDLFELVGGDLVPLAEAREVLGLGPRVTAALDHEATVVTRLSAAEAATGYTLTFQSGTCFADDIDDTGSNETIGESQPFDEAAAYAVCPGGDEDWLSFQVAGGPSSVRVGVRVDDPSAEFDLELHDDDAQVDGDVVAAADETTPPSGGFVFTPATELTDGTYHVRMRSDRALPLPFAYDVVVLQSAP